MRILSKRIFQYFILVLLLLVLSTISSANIFNPIDGNQGDIDVDDYWVSDGEEIETSDYDPDANKISQSNSEGDILEKNIDPDNDLGINDMITILLMFGAGILVFIIIIVFASLKKFSGVALMLLTIIVMVLAAGIVTVIFTNSNFITQWIYGDSNEVWGETTIEVFRLEDLNDMELQYSHDAAIEELNTYTNIPRESILDIESAQTYSWEKDSKQREAVVIQFTDSKAAKKFVDSVFEPKAKLSLRKEDYFWGALSGAEEDKYSNPYLMQENRFVFMVFGEGAYSENAINKIIDYYPEEYHYTKDDNGPTINIVKPATSITGLDTIEFTIEDKTSGVNFVSIDVINTKNDFDPLTYCKQISGQEEVIRCIIPNGLTKDRDSFTIYASDNEHNYAQKEVLYQFDNEKPNIKLFDVTDDGRIVFEITDDTKNSIETVQLQDSSRTIVVTDSCHNANKSMKYICNIRSNDLKQGQVRFEIIVKDKAGNIARESLVTVIDTKPPQISFTKPRSESSNEKIIEFDIIDDESGIDERSISIMLNDLRMSDSCLYVNQNKFRCRITDKIIEGENNIEIIVKDFKDNTFSETNIFFIDAEKPSIEFISGNIGDYEEISFRINDAGSGIDQNRIIINGNTFNVDSICSKANEENYLCSYTLDTTSAKVIITAWDNAGNKNDFTQILN